MMDLNALRILYFSEMGITAIKHSKIHPLLPFILAVLIQSFPSNFENIEGYLARYVLNFVIVAISLAVMITMIYATMKAIGSRIRFKEYFLQLSIVIFIISFISILFAFLLIEFGMIIGYPEVAFKLVQGSVIVYYLLVVFAWSSERFAGFDEPKAAIGGLVSLTLIYIFHLILNVLP